jgi:hypothetical protein
VRWRRCSDEVVRWGGALARQGGKAARWRSDAPTGRRGGGGAKMVGRRAGGAPPMGGGGAAS